ncbi:hypothetical protein ACFQO1_08710 [Jejudonia soesokkakensis]|uniref:Uncharacterized protein n=1 Tax=Jejudonia soesokkakensis TaxID=1323432 RepID=A0ABW2MSA0_9FLAO
MLKKKILYIFLFVITGSIAQEQVGQLDISNIGSFGKDNFSITNYKNDNLVSAIMHNGNITVHHLNKDFEQISMPLTRDLDNGGLNNLVGYKIIDNKYSFIYSDNVRNALAVFTFSFDTNLNEKHKIDLDYKGERIVEAFSSYQNRFFVFFASIDGDLILRELEDNFSSLKEIARFPISDKDIDGNKVEFKRHFLYSKANYTTFEDNAPSPVSKSFSKYKLFNQKNSLVLTVENNNLGTSLYKIDLETLKLSEKFFIYPKGKLSNYEEYNSFVSNNNVFLIAVSNDEMSLQINSLESSFSKEYYITKDEEITFKNTVINQKGLTMVPFQGNRNFETTSKFLRKISSETVGVNIYYEDNSYEVTIGGLKDNVVQGILMVSTGGYGLNTDQITKITCLFDQNFLHVDKNIEMSSFDLLNQFEKELKSDKNSNVFYFNGDLIYSYVYKKEALLRYLKF